MKSDSIGMISKNLRSRSLEMSSFNVVPRSISELLRDSMKNFDAQRKRRENSTDFSRVQRRRKSSSQASPGDDDFCCVFSHHFLPASVSPRSLIFYRLSRLSPLPFSLVSFSCPKRGLCLALINRIQLY